MPYARDDFTTLRAKALADLGSRLEDCDPYQRRSALYVLGTVFAKFHDLQLGYLDWQARQAVPFTATGEYELGWGSLRGLGLIPPARAKGGVVFTGNPGATVFSALQLRRGDGVLYTVPHGAPVGENGSVTIPVLAQLGGANGNADPDTGLTLVSTLPGISDSAKVGEEGLAGGADRETAEAFRTRILQRYSRPPQGGALDDYVGWALSVPAVTRAWCYGGAGSGSVVVYFMEDDARSDRYGIPAGNAGVSQYETRFAAASDDALSLADALYLKRPAQALVFAAPPIPEPVPLIIGEVPSDDIIRQAVIDAYAAFMRRDSSPGGCLLADLSPGGVVRRAKLDAAIAAVPGLDYYLITSPLTDVESSLGAIAVPGPVTFL